VAKRSEEAKRIHDAEANCSYDEDSELLKD
jgi:hypothetical protein